MNRKPIALNTTFALLAALAALAALSAPAARAEPAAILASSSAGVGSAAAGSISATIAGLSAASLQALPGFPMAAYRDGYRDGKVTLAYTVQADGAVSDVRVLHAYPKQVFTRTAVGMVSSWRFVPSVMPQARQIEVQFSAR
jgi:TonB family protein